MAGRRPEAEARLCLLRRAALAASGRIFRFLREVLHSVSPSPERGPSRGPASLPGAGFPPLRPRAVRSVQPEAAVSSGVRAPRPLSSSLCRPHPVALTRGDSAPQGTFGYSWRRFGMSQNGGSEGLCYYCNLEGGGQGC